MQHCDGELQCKAMHEQQQVNSPHAGRPRECEATMLARTHDVQVAAVIVQPLYPAGVRGDVRLNGKKADADDMRHIAVSVLRDQQLNCCGTRVLWQAPFSDRHSPAHSVGSLSCLILVYCCDYALQPRTLMCNKHDQAYQQYAA